MESREYAVWRKHSDIISEIITDSDAARNSLLNKLHAAGLVARNAKILIQGPGQTAMAGANILVDELLATIKSKETKFHEIVSVMAEVEQLEKVVEDMRKQCPNPNAVTANTDGDALGMCNLCIIHYMYMYSDHETKLIFQFRFQM